MSSTKPGTTSPRKTWQVLDRFATGANVAIVSTAALTLVYICVPFMQAARLPRPVVLPGAMVAVDWRTPESSQYCLACHEQVSPAMAGLAVERGHSQNVPLNELQLAAIRSMGTVAGPDNTLICMSCHQLDPKAGGPWMLADSLEDSRLCRQCHPGHYARGTAHDLRLSAPTTTNLQGHTVADGGPCSACHLSHGFAREITRSELDPEGYCMPCHAAAGVAADHPRVTMDHPDSRCRDCHDPHDDTHGEFLRKPVAELCVGCHARYDEGRAAGMHPLGRMKDPIPQALIEAGAHAMGDLHNLTCVVCHDTHKAEHESLLHLTPRANELCLTCHEEKLLARSHDAILPRHGQQPKLNERQLAVVEAWGNPVGPQGELLCVSCHRVHGAEPDTDLLTFTPKYGDTCVACHPAEESVFGTSHDLRINHAELPNSEGMTPLASGACSACHLSHGFPRERVPTAADPGGQCLSCHRSGDCAVSSLAGATPHPDTACIECHDPHTRRVPRFLRQEPTQLCTSCHAAQAGLDGGPHDPRSNPQAWPAEAREAPGSCLPCHVAHGGEQEHLLRITSRATGSPDDACLGCHPDTDWTATSTIAAIHPQEVRPAHVSDSINLLPADAAGNRRLGCRTCHNPHGGPRPQHLARVAQDQPSEELCLGCHTEKRLIRFTGHSADRLNGTGYPIESCKPCHAMHAAPQGSWGQALSPRFLVDGHLPMPESGDTDRVPCLSCHHPGGPAPVREIASHPEVLTTNIFEPGDPAYMPLFGPDGSVDTHGQVTCRTCHLSHGRLDLLIQLDRKEELSPSERAQLKAQIRPFEQRNICTSCHNANARVLFLYFHDKQRRDAIDTKTTAP